MEKESGWRRNQDGEGIRTEKVSGWERNLDGEGIGLRRTQVG